MAGSGEEQDQFGCCVEDKDRVRKLREEVSVWVGGSSERGR